MNIGKKLLLGALSASAAFGLFAQNMADADVFHMTARSLDSDALSYTYSNLPETTKFVRGIVDLFSHALNRENPAPETAKMETAFRNFMSESGLNAIRGVGMSVRRENGMYTLKQKIFAPPAEQKGLLWTAAPQNRTWTETTKLIPSTAVAFASFTVNARPVYDYVLNSLKTVLEPEDFAEIENSIAEAKAQGFDLPVLVSAAHSITVFADCAPGQPQIAPGLTGGTLFLEIDTDALFKALAKQMPPEAVKNGVIQIPETPFVVFQSGKYFTVTTSPDFAKAILAGTVKTINFLPEFASARETMPDTVFFAAGWTPRFGTVLNSLAAAFAPKELVPSVAEAIPLFGFDCMMLGCASRVPDGFFAMGRSTSGNLFLLAGNPPSFFGSVVPVFAGMALPALGSSRNAAKDINCVNNLKQIGTGLIIYADENGSFPKQEGIAGLEELHKKGMIESQCFICPRSGKRAAPVNTPLEKNTCSYFYFGGITPADPPSLPIVMCLPGTHKNKEPVLRVEGSVFRPAWKSNTLAGRLEEVLGHKAATPRELDMLRQAQAWDAARGPR